MAERINNASDLVGPLVRVSTGHVVSSPSMVSRAFLRDSWLGVVVEAVDGSLWLASTFDALAPDPQDLIVRGAANGGPPVEYGSPRLTSVTLSWGGLPPPHEARGEAEVANPVVIKHPAGASVAVIRLAKARALAEAIAAGDGPTPLRLADGFAEIGTARSVAVLSLLEDSSASLWPVLRPVHVVSDAGGGFFGEPGGVALGIRIEESDSGAPAFAADESGHRFCGILRPLAPGLSLLVTAQAIAETIAQA